MRSNGFFFSADGLFATHSREWTTLELLGITPPLPYQNLEAEVGIGPFRRGFQDKNTQFTGLLKRYFA